MAGSNGAKIPCLLFSRNASRQCVDSRGPEAVDIIRSLIEEVRLVPADGALIVELRGELAGALAISESAKHPFVPAPERALQI